MPIASVIICTHNRAEILAATLAGVTGMSVPPGGAELVLVDNASADDTKAVVEAYSARIPIPVRYVYESTLGLSNARNRGVAESNGEILAFLDDDAVPHPEWLSALCDTYRAHGDAECVGGLITLDWKSPPPEWWTPDMDHHLSAVDYGPLEKRLTHPHYPYGANISYKKTVFERGLFFDPSLGRRGRHLGGGEEMSLCLAIEKDGGGIYYAPNSRVWHRAEAVRANTGYLYRKSYLHGRSAARVESVHMDFDTRIRKAASFATQAIVWRLKRGASVEDRCALRYRFGYVVETLRLAFLG